MFKNKSQIWYMDFVMGVTIFTLIVILAFKFLSDTTYIPGKETNYVLIDSDKISNSLLTPGVPPNWTQEYVVAIGIMSKSNVLNTTKLDFFKNMTIKDYENVKYLFGVESDFIIFFENNNTLINITNQTFIGKPGITLSSLYATNPENRLTISRYVVYRHDNIADIISLKVLTWQE